MYNRSKTCKKYAKAFTLVELMVSVGIFAFMTALMVAKYGNFNQSVLLTNLAYDVAVTIRTAQSYGLSVKGIDGSDTDKFQSAYGVHFDSHMSGGQNSIFTLYADNGTNDGVFDPGDEVINTYNIKRGAVIQWLCVSSTCGSPDDAELDITFKRPEPEARIMIYDDSAGLIDNASYAEITIRSTDNNTRKIIVRENGQISVTE